MTWAGDAGLTAVSIEERVGRLGGGYEYLATKADLAQFTADTRTEVADFREEMQTEYGEFRTAMQSENAEFRAVMPATLADQRTATQADIKDFELPLTAAVNQFLIRAMQWTVLFVSVAAGVLVAVDRLLGPAVGG